MQVAYAQGAGAEVGPPGGVLDGQAAAADDVDGDEVGASVGVPVARDARYGVAELPADRDVADQAAFHPGAVHAGRAVGGQAQLPYVGQVAEAALPLFVQEVLPVGVLQRYGDGRPVPPWRPVDRLRPCHPCPPIVAPMFLQPPCPASYAAASAMNVPASEWSLL
ncbi:hypothetical protein ABT404_34070 [Streptomyces hyaluromycini]|uniref:Uncharacterized protein n=1 Tax=Streptomyces hyaluromycini TaxID=1377993 RepID=A0ABV1X611_9ACTN